MNLEKLCKMAKSKEITKDLLKNENFKEEIKDGLKKECGVEITEQQLSGIIENFENSLASNQILSNEELELVSGGAKVKAQTAIKFIFTFLGMHLGKSLSTLLLGNQMGGVDIENIALPKGTEEQQAWLRNNLGSFVTSNNLRQLDMNLHRNAIRMPITLLGVVVGRFLGKKFCEYYEIKN